MVGPDSFHHSSVLKLKPCEVLLSFQFAMRKHCNKFSKLLLYNICFDGNLGNTILNLHMLLSESDLTFIVSLPYTMIVVSTFLLLFCCCYYYCQNYLPKRVFSCFLHKISKNSCSSSLLNVANIYYGFSSKTLYLSSFLFNV